MQNKAVTAPIVGPRAEEHLAAAIDAPDMELDFLEALERLFPDRA
jgi:hypothetical protein